MCKAIICLSTAVALLLPRIGCLARGCWTPQSVVHGGPVSCRSPPQRRLAPSCPGRWRWRQAPRQAVTEAVVQHGHLLSLQLGWQVHSLCTRPPPILDEAPAACRMPLPRPHGHNPRLSSDSQRALPNTQAAPQKRGQTHLAQTPPAASHALPVVPGDHTRHETCEARAPGPTLKQEYYELDVTNLRSIPLFGRARPWHTKPRGAPTPPAR